MSFVSPLLKLIVEIIIYEQINIIELKTDCYQWPIGQHNTMTSWAADAGADHLATSQSTLVTGWGDTDVLVKVSLQTSSLCSNTLMQNQTEERTEPNSSVTLYFTASLSLH